MKIRAEINKVKNRKITERKINETKVGPFEKINKITESLVKMAKKERRFKLLKSRTKEGHHY